MTLTRARLAGIYFFFFFLKRTWERPIARWIRSSGYDPGFIRTTEWDCRGPSGPFLMENNCDLQMPVFDREREREREREGNLWKRRNVKTESFCSLFYFDYRNCPGFSFAIDRWCCWYLVVDRLMLLLSDACGSESVFLYISGSVAFVLVCTDLVEIYYMSHWRYVGALLVVLTSWSWRLLKYSCG